MRQSKGAINLQLSSLPAQLYLETTAKEKSGIAKLILNSPARVFDLVSIAISQKRTFSCSIRNSCSGINLMKNWEIFSTGSLLSSHVGRIFVEWTKIKSNREQKVLLKELNPRVWLSFWKLCRRGKSWISTARVCLPSGHFSTRGKRSRLLSFSMSLSIFSITWIYWTNEKWFCNFHLHRESFVTQAYV